MKMKQYNPIDKIPLPDKKYEIIYADPPWSFSNKKTGGSLDSGSEDQYKVLTLDQICNLNVKSISEDNCFLFLWWVASQPLEAIKVVDAWGFKLKTMTCFSWIKKTVSWKDHFGMGFYTRQQQEHCLIAVKGKPKVKSHSVRQNIRECVLGHSIKPKITYSLIDDICGHEKRKIELFARSKMDSWDNWGDEV
jgi:N6-adenosine-specific RNA methylase IME4